MIAISQAEAMPGDFALYPDASHVGLIVGRNEAGKLLVCHCSYGMNNVVVTEFVASGFTDVGRQPLVPGDHKGCLQYSSCYRNDDGLHDKCVCCYYTRRSHQRASRDDRCCG